MSKFQDDVKLLGDLQALIAEAEKTANMDPAAQMAVKMVSPSMKKLIPTARTQAQHRIDVLTRAKTRLAELMEADQSRK